MTERERFLNTLDRLPVPGRVPTYEQVFFLTMEAFGRVHPLQRQFAQWGQMSSAERDRHARDLAEIYLDVRRSLREGMARGRGYVFCTSNCAYTGLDLARYELMNRTWHEEGIYG
ncbi:MAG: hypothetical protein LBK76_04170 [Verrucomicrobiales bacterium]|nr:hypothetical protein [Verrucomicrobiales bacterium]